MDFSSIQAADIYLINLLGGRHTIFADSFMSVLTSPYTWIPFYIALFIMIIKNNETTRHIALILLMSAAAVLLSGVFGNIFVKPYFARLRPFDDASAAPLLQLVNGVNDSGYSFFSAHSANTMAVAVFLMLLVRSRIFGIFMLAWSLINGYSRIYLCAHYPSDVAAGLIWGAAAGTAVYFLYRFIVRRTMPVYRYVSSEYTSKGYSYGDIDMAITVFVFTIVYAIMYALI